MSRTDILVVGSGPSGAQAAKRAIEDGLTVTMLDVGNDEYQLAQQIPQMPFTALRQTDPNQREYFLGGSFGSEVDRNDRLGSHFTPPRAYITKDVHALLPVESNTFFPVQSLALGGLGVGWGAGCQKYEAFELREAGLPASEMESYYDEVVRDIGVSGAPEDDIAEQLLATRYLQPPTEIDTNARSIFRNYRKRREELRRMGLNMGRDPLAMLTCALERSGMRREANPYTDMDYYGNPGESVYRPRQTIIELRRNPAFQYISGALVQTFEETGEGVEVVFLNLASGTHERISGKKLLLAAGALNSARIALRSRQMYGVRIPVISNAMHYMACSNLAMLGRAADDRRHSLGQLIGVYTPPHRAPEHVVLAMITYRSLLYFRIVRQMPLPPNLGVLLSRALLTSLTMFGVHHPERGGPDKWISLEHNGGGDVLHAHYGWSEKERALIAADIRGVKRLLWKLRVAPLATFEAPAGGSIHYAGTVPSSPGAQSAALQGDGHGKLRGAQHVFFADSSCWNYLPAKGLTFTLMANARRVAREAAAELRSG